LVLFAGKQKKRKQKHQCCLVHDIKCLGSK
jgi:hypothetical protein